MSSLRGLLDTARSALLAHQRAIQLTGSNIANVNTEGYSRQRLDLASRAGQRLGGIGAGVEPVAVRRLRMESFDRSFRSEQSGLGMANMRDLHLAGLESVMGEPGSSGLGDALNAFWTAWSDLSNEPTESSYRQTVIEAGHQLAGRFHQLNGQIAAQQQDINNEVERTGSEINRLATSIADLNQAIRQSELAGDSAADLRDQRDLLVDELSLLVDLDAAEDEQGTFRVWVGGRALVDGTHVSQIEHALNTDQDGTVRSELRWSDTGSLLRTPSGELAGLYDVRDRVLAERLVQLDELADALVRQVNELHAEGYDLNGNSGVAFFDAGSGGAAGIAVRALLLEDPDRLAASVDGGSGNGDQAARIAELASQGLDALSGHSLEEAWSLMVSATGAERRSASLEFEAQQSFVSNLDSRRQAVSGVNLDEELTLMMSQEQAYAAAARVVSVADELMQTVLGLVS